MSNSTTIEIYHAPVAAKQRRSFSRWLAVEARALTISFRRWRRLAADRAALHALDDRMLSDIGIRRGQIDSAVRGQR